jgi:hypothetical protein
VPPLRTLKLGELDVEMWFGVLAPAGTPRAIADRPPQQRAEGHPGAARREDRVRDAGHEPGAQQRPSSAADREGRQRWAQVIKARTGHPNRIEENRRLKVTMDILIIGAGLGGLAAAAALLQRGHRVRVFEQAPQLGEVGAGIQMSANAMKVLDHLGLRAALEPVAVRPLAFEFRASTAASCCTASRSASRTSSAMARPTSSCTAPTCTGAATGGAALDRRPSRWTPAPRASSSNGRRRHRALRRPGCRCRPSCWSAPTASARWCAATCSATTAAFHRPGGLALHGAHRAHPAGAAHRPRVSPSGAGRATMR